MSGTASVEAWSGKDRRDENFPVGSRLIRADLRAHVHAFYSFARNADDIADSPVLTAQDKLDRLDIMEEVLLGRRDHGAPSALTLRASLAATGVASIHASELLVAFRRDATKRRYATIAELDEYCRYSAAPVGRYVLDLHGESPATHAPSDALCAALQVLNHLQDCGHDLVALDRCYLPEDLLNRLGGSIGELRRPSETPALRAVFDALLSHVDHWVSLAPELPRRVASRRLRVETAVIVGLARRLAVRLRHEDPLAHRVKLTRRDIALSIGRALRFL